MTSPEQVPFTAQDFARPGPDTSRARSGGKTDWAGMSIDEVIDILTTMQAGNARGDAETVLKAIAAVRRASEQMSEVFGDDDMEGLGSHAALEAGRSLAADMASSLSTASIVGDALERSVGILGAARGQEGRLRELQHELRENPENAAAVRYEVERTMTGTYSTPMREVNASLPVDAPAAVRFLEAGVPSGGGPGSGGSGSESGRGQAANTVDAGDLGRSGGAPVLPPPGGPAAPPNANRPGPAVPVSSAGAAPGSATRRSSEDPDGLLRGGRGTADGDAAEARSASAVGAGRSGSAADAATSETERPGVVPPVVPLAPAAPNVAAGPAPAAAGTGSSPGGGAPRMTPIATTPTGPAGAPAAPRRTASEDDTHKAAPYLHNREHGAELVGDLPLVGPPVIGDWVPPTPTSTQTPTPQTPTPQTPTDPTPAGTEPAVPAAPPSPTTGADVDRTPTGDARDDHWDAPRQPSAT